MNSFTRFAAPDTLFARLRKLSGTASFRLTLFHAALFAISGSALFGMIYWVAVNFAAQDEAKEIELEFALIEQEIGAQGLESLPQVIENHLRRRQDVRAVYLLQSADGRKIAGNVDVRPATLGPTVVDAVFGGERLSVRAHGFRLANGSYLLVGQDAHILREMEETLLQTFGVGLVLVLLLTVLGGGFLSARYVSRVEEVSRTARAIVAGNMAHRAKVLGRHDEFDDLAKSLNAMLDRIDELMRSMRQMSSDVAHDLRTPLTRLRQRLEQVQRRANSEDDYRDAVSTSISELDSILATFVALLQIAQIEAGEQAMPSAEVDLSTLVRSICNDFSPAAEDQGHTLVADVEPSVTTIGDRLMLTQLLGNLLDNAIRHTPEGTQIVLFARTTNEHAVIGVADNGPGIPESEHANVLRPFYRLEASRTTEGSGLGLNLVAAIAKQHRGTLKLFSNGPGLVVEIWLSRSWRHLI